VPGRFAIAGHHLPDAPYLSAPAPRPGTKRPHRCADEQKNNLTPLYLIYFHALHPAGAFDTIAG
jgi:hypothetical protein